MSDCGDIDTLRRMARADGLSPATAERVLDALADARATITRLNRRCQQADAALAEKIVLSKLQSPNLGRALANYAASLRERERDEARAERDALQAEVAQWRRAHDGAPAEGEVSVPEDAPYVCPGCHAVGEERCAPDCIDAAIEADRERRGELDDGPCYEDDGDVDGDW